VRYVRDVHQPTRMMVLSEAPASLRAMALPAQRLCDDMQLRVYPLKRRPSYVTPYQTATPITWSETLEGLQDGWYTLSRLPA
jgi:hypothetical protein